MLTTDLVTDIESIDKRQWTDDYVRRYQHAMYGASHQRAYLQVRSETLAALLDECRVDGRPLRVLEVACGPGLSLDYLRRSGRGDHLTGIDMSGDMLRLAQRNLAEDGGSTPRFAQASARDLPFADGSFDVVYATRFIHIFRNKGPVVEELKRVVRGGGLVIVEFYGRPYHLLRYFMRYVTGRAREPLGEYLYHYPGLAEVRGVMGRDARYIPLRFGAERWLRRLIGASRLRAVLGGAWRTPMRPAIAEYFAVLRRV